MEGIRARLQESEALDYTVSELKKGFTSEEGKEQLAQVQQKQSRLRLEMERLAEAIAKSGGSDFLIEALTKKETELKKAEATIKALAQLSVPVDLKWLRKQVTEAIKALPALLHLDPERAKMHILKHVSEIRMFPTEENGRKFYVAEGDWFALENENVAGALLDGDAITSGMVAGARFELATFGL